VAFTRCFLCSPAGAMAFAESLTAEDFKVDGVEAVVPRRD
jgi:hypothetical protein